MGNTRQLADKLMEQLEREGFTGHQLNESIIDGIEMGLPVFWVDYTAFYGQERMTYQLLFRHSHNEEMPYVFTELVARHRDPVDIVHETVNGIDSGALDARMALVDWDVFFSRDQVSPGIILNDLRTLGAGEHPGKFLQQCLMYKHWPEAIYRKFLDPMMPDLTALHEHSYTFRTSNGDVLNAHLAYHIISERYYSLRDKIEAIGLDRIGISYPVDDVLTTNLRMNPDAFQLNGHFNLPEGYAEFCVPVEKVNGWYSIQEYELNFTPYPAIAHGVFDGINTTELEAEMRKVDWLNDQALFHFHEHAEPEFKGKVNDIQDQLYRLSLDLAGAEVADLLRLKYLINVTFFGDNIDQRAWDRLAELPKLTRKFPADQDIATAARLLAGRFVFASVGPDHAANERHWCSLDLNNAAGGYPAKSFEGFSRNELEDLLRPVNIYLTDRSRAASELMTGKLALLKTSGEKHVLVEAKPENKELLFYTEDLRPIPFNLHMDPDWLPEPYKSAKNKQKTVLPITGKRKAARKGGGPKI